MREQNYYRLSGLYPFNAIKKHYTKTLLIKGTNTSFFPIIKCIISDLFFRILKINFRGLFFEASEPAQISRI